MVRMIFILFICFNTLSCAQMNPTAEKPSDPASASAPAAPASTPPAPPMDPDWKKIWNGDEIAHLNQYAEAYGLYLESYKNKPTSYFVEENGCGEIYRTLVKSAKELTQPIWEIDQKGNVLQNWRTGAKGFAQYNGKPAHRYSAIFKIEGSKIYRNVMMFEDPQDFKEYLKSKNKSSSHSFYMTIDSNNKFQITEREEAQMVPQNFERINCPKIPETLKRFEIYCVKNQVTQKIYALEYACT